MRLLLRLWAWVRGLFRKQEYPLPKVSEPFDHTKLFEDYWGAARRKSANICLASRGATRREKDNARGRT